MGRCRWSGESGQGAVIGADLKHLVAQRSIFMHEGCRLIPFIKPGFEANIEGTRIAQPIGDVGSDGPAPPQLPYVSLRPERGRTKKKPAK